MTDFIQIHFLTAYPASCLVRDDTGMPKSMMYGGAPRGRVSSAALKRAVRISDEFQAALQGNLGTRTQRLGVEVEKVLAEQTDLDEAKRQDLARKVAGVFGKLKAEKDKDPLETEQLAFISPEEAEAAKRMALKLAAGELDEDEAKAALKDLIQGAVKAVDVALFGRMFADRSEMRMTAAAQVAHPFTVGRAETELDYYVAVDDLNDRSEDAGSAFIGEQGFLSGLFYGYASINKDLLIENLGGDDDLADRAIAAFVRGLATVSPTGKVASFGSHARASYVRVERGTAAPRSLAAAFLKPVDDPDQLSGAIKALDKTAAGFARVYGDDPETVVVDATKEDGPGLDEAVALTQGPARAEG